ncbi:hypothetical protein BC629DRAFT_566856 [Irpex lacteus]|nr:hypothetical protein BC629DRAFT_566856 [Irpex lacteus]
MAEQTLIVQKPSASAYSRPLLEARYKSSNEGDAPKVPAARKGTRNTGRLAQLMDMPVDIVLEVMALLCPSDLLNISRVSRHFRKILLHRSSKGMWVAARKNARDPPLPPDSLSEPKYASLLFEHTCQACGTSRAGKVSFAMSLRLCTACWRDNHKSAKPKADILFSLLPSQEAGPSRRYATYYFAAEFQAVFERYQSLSGTKQDEFVEERRVFVKAMEQHASAVAAWQSQVKQDQNEEDREAAINREKSVLAKLIEMGYSEDQFPSRWMGSWRSLISQPRELTPRIWKQILPKLEACIKEEAQRKEKEARGQRMEQRQNELCSIYKNYLAELPLTYSEPLPTYYELLGFDEVNHMLQRDDGTLPVSLEDFASIAPTVLDEHAQRMSLSLTEFLHRAFHSDASQSEADTANKMSLNLDSVFAISSCGYCYSGYERSRPYSYSFSELKRHIRDRHVMEGYSSSAGCIIAASRIDIIRKILAALDISEDARYDDVSKRVVCLCGKPSFQQPAEFSALVYHFESECNLKSDVLRAHVYRSGMQGVGTVAPPSLFEDHDLEQLEHPTLLKLLENNETYTPEEVTVPEGLNMPTNGAWCKRCGKSSYARFTDVTEFAWHVRAKHRAEPTVDDLIN